MRKTGLRWTERVRATSRVQSSRLRCSSIRDGRRNEASWSDQGLKKHQPGCHPDAKRDNNWSVRTQILEDHKTVSPVRAVLGQIQHGPVLRRIQQILINPITTTEHIIQTTNNSMPNIYNFFFPSFHFSFPSYVGVSVMPLKCRPFNVMERSSCSCCRAAVTCIDSALFSRSKVPT